MAFPNPTEEVAMAMRTFPLYCLSLLLLCCAGCAPKAVILEPGPVVLVPRQAAAEAGVLWVSDARDVRAANQAGPKVGTFFTTFRKAPQVVYVEPKPEIYVKDQLARHFFNIGLEAQTASAARGLVAVDLEEFSLVESPGSVWDEVRVRLAYTLRILDPSGQEVAKVRLEGGQKLKAPLDTKRQVEAAFRDALMDTFQSLSRSEAFRGALAALAR
jgi:hypothetical protein